jgi:DNA-binding XRE family transcriptional regulator
MKNRLRMIREKRRLSQSALAQAAGTSQQQIQRIEVGRQTVRLDLAFKICHALNSKIEEIFPQTRKLMKGLKSNSEEEYVDKILNDEKIEREAAKAGIDLNPAFNFIKIGFRTSTKSEIFQISSADKTRLWSAIQQIDDSKTDFFVFDTPNSVGAIGLNHVSFCHFLFDYNVAQKEESMEEVRVLLSNSSRDLTFRVEPDTGDPDDPESNGDFKTILELMELDMEGSHMFHFVDEDGETVFLRADSICIMEVPLWVVYPDVLDEPSEANSDQASAENPNKN